MIAMSSDPRAVAKVHARAFNAHDTDTLAYQYTRAARCILDGTWIGEGPDAVRKGIEAEYGAGAWTRVLDVDGEPVLAEFDGDEGHEQLRGVIRLHQTEDGMIDEIRIEHGGAFMARLA